MHRTEGQYHSSNLFADGPPGTRVEQNWLNTIQEEIANVIEQSGIALLTAGTDTRDQLYTAILNTVRLPRGYIDGLGLSNAADTSHDITMAIGKARDSGDDYTINSTIPLTKQIDVAWAAGSSQGGFPSGLGVVGNDTWYHFFAIMKTDGTVDAGYDTSLTAANLLAAGDAGGEGYTLYRRVGSVLTDGAANIIQFNQYGDLFKWRSPQQDFNSVIGAASGLETLTVPTGLQIEAIFSCYAVGSTTSGVLYFSCPDATDEAAGQYKQTMFFGDNDAGIGYGGQILNIMTNTSAQIRGIASNNVTVSGATAGWIDKRGKDA